MLIAPRRADDVENISAVKRLDVLDSPKELIYDELIELAQEFFSMPIVLLSFVDIDRHWFKASLGTNVKEVPRDLSFCSHTILQSRPLVVCDLKLDARFADSPFVCGGPMVSFYAGAPLITLEGRTVGTFCLLDTEPRDFAANQQLQLEKFARQAIAHLESHRIQNELTQQFYRYSAVHRSVTFAAPDFPTAESFV